MSDKIRARHIIERWHLSIKKEDRTKENMSRVFDDVASQLFCAGIDFEIAYDGMVEAAKLMYPKAEVAKSTFKKLNIPKLDLDEFIKNWQSTLNNRALEAFYSYYEIDGANTNKAPEKPKTGAKTEDELNEEDFWKKVKLVSKENPWLYPDEDQK